MESLVIVESGAKASKIKGFLDANFKNEEWHVAACLGHIRDLSDDDSAVNPEDWTDLKSVSYTHLTLPTKRIV